MLFVASDSPDPDGFSALAAAGLLTAETAPTEGMVETAGAINDAPTATHPNMSPPDACPPHAWLQTVLHCLTTAANTPSTDLSAPHAMPIPSHQRVQQALAVRVALEAASDAAAVQAMCGYDAAAFAAAEATPPLTAAAVQHFCRNHRDADASLAGQFAAHAELLPEALAALYHLYNTQTRLDAEAALFLAQTSGSIRVAQSMAHLLAIGGFQHGDTALPCAGRVYAVAAAFDTAPVIDAANYEAKELLALPVDHPEHLLQLAPDAISLLAAELAAQHRLTMLEFLAKANLLAEARQDVNRFPVIEQFATALYEGDLPISEAWVVRLVTAMRAVVPAFVGALPARLEHTQGLSA
jgi:hypothetical protein